MSNTERPYGCGCYDGVRCRLCELADLPAAEPPAECVHRGQEPIRRHGSNRDWRACNHPAQPLGPVVCSCQGCGPKCSGYTA